MSHRPTSTDTHNATSSPESPAGPSPCDSPECRQLRLFGQAPAPVSHSVPPAKDSAKKTRDTSGPTSSASSASATLQQSLASRLAQLLSTDGSIEYSLTWREKLTPAGRPYCQLVASARRTSDRGCSGWPTPQTHDTQEQGHGRLLTATGRIQCHNGGSYSADLPLVAKLAGWATPTAVNHRSVKSNQHGKNARPLQEQAGTTTPSSTAETASPAASPTLNPAFSRWLMAFPETWDAASPNWLAWSRVQELIASAV